MGGYSRNGVNGTCIDTESVASITRGVLVGSAIPPKPALGAAIQGATMRVATFNVENLFTRFRFARGVDSDEARDEGFTVDDLKFRLHDAQAKRLTADTMLACQADVFALQEVEGLDTLKQFRDRFLGGREVWPHALVIDGNDQRRIDVGVLSRFPIVHARSWQHQTEGGKLIWDRDCLEVDIDGPHGLLTLYVNHFKSMRAPEGTKGSGRALTQPRRVQQARGVMDVVRSRFGEDPSHGSWIVVGDLNDHGADDEQGPTALRELLDWDAMENVVDRLPADLRWTHFYRGSSRHGLPAAYRQLDYVLPSRRLAGLNPSQPVIERRGQPKRAARFEGERFVGVGRDRPKASDHCPVCFDIDAM